MFFYSRDQNLEQKSTEEVSKLAQINEYRVNILNNLK